MSTEILQVLFQFLTFIAVVFAAWQILFHARQMHRDMELFYVGQYWKIMSRMSPEWRVANFTGEPPTLEDQRLVLEYIQLCDDEIQLRKEARVTDSTWKLWNDAIAFSLTRAAFAQALEDPSAGGMYSHVRALLSSPTPHTYDPLKRSVFWRRLHGL
jgi:hypothetical protein